VLDSLPLPFELITIQSPAVLFDAVNFLLVVDAPEIGVYSPTRRLVGFTTLDIKEIFPKLTNIVSQCYIEDRAVE
jgi:hypothetical protein